MSYLLYEMFKHVHLLANVQLQTAQIFPLNHTERVSYCFIVLLL